MTWKFPQPNPHLQNEPCIARVILMVIRALARTRSLPPHLLHHAHQRDDADDQAYYEGCHTQRPLDLLLQGSNHANLRRRYADDSLENGVDVSWSSIKLACLA